MFKEPQWQEDDTETTGSQLKPWDRWQPYVSGPEGKLEIWVDEGDVDRKKTKLSVAI